MLQQVEIGSKSLEDYRPVVGDELIDEIHELARPLQGMSVVNVNATAFGGGVAEILPTLCALMQDVGLKVEWQVIEGSDEYFKVTKAKHNGLQGMAVPFTGAMQDIWRRYNEMNAGNFEGRYDIAVIHDPQPAGLLRYTNGANAENWVWRCHIDTSHPNPDFWDFLAPYLNDYPSAVFTMEQYVGPGVAFANLGIIPPTIDPLSPKNSVMDPKTAADVVRSYSMDPDRPLAVQVSRFDPWKDPLGVIDAYRIAKEKVPGVQLALIGSMASDDPEGWDYYDKTLRRAGEDFDVRILHNFHGVGSLEVNAFQTVADLAIQKSTREGFGLTVTEAMWKGKPVIGGNVGGIPLQVLDGQTGFLVDSIQGCADRMLYLLDHPEESRRMGQAAREHVRRNFMTTNQLANYLRLFGQIVASG